MRVTLHTGRVTQPVAVNQRAMSFVLNRAVFVCCDPHARGACMCVCVSQLVCLSVSEWECGTHLHTAVVDDHALELYVRVAFRHAAAALEEQTVRQLPAHNAHKTNFTR